MGASSKYLVIYHAISAGQNGPNLGCDEEEIVMILYLVLNAAENKVSFVRLDPRIHYFTIGNLNIFGLWKYFYEFFEYLLLTIWQNKMNQECMAFLWKWLSEVSSQCPGDVISTHLERSPDTLVTWNDS